MIDIKIHLYLRAACQKDLSRITVKLDEEILPLMLRDYRAAEVQFCDSLDQGLHTLEVGLAPMPDAHTETAGIINVDRVCFQNIDHDFGIHGYVINTEVLDPVRASDQISSGQKWILDFQVPIYRWIHQKMNLGWLI